MKFIRNNIIALIVLYLIASSLCFEIGYKTERARIRNSYLRSKLKKRNLKRNTHYKSKTSFYSNHKHAKSQMMTNDDLFPIDRWILIKNQAGNGLCLSATTDGG